MLDLTGLQRDCIVAIDSHESLKGLTVTDALDVYYGKEIADGRLYPNLEELVSAGYVEKGQIDDRTNSDSLTGARVD